jgi:4-alpha-glucanotransferase
VADVQGPLAELADRYGIATEFWDWQGRHVSVAAETVIAVLRALGVEASTPEATTAALAARRDEPWRRMLPLCMVTREGTTPSVPVHVEHGTPVEVWVELERGGVRDDLRQLENWNGPQRIDDRLVGEASFEVPGDLPLGYHTLRARSGDDEACATLVVTPQWIGVTGRLRNGRGWGLAAQLYSVHSRQSWGVGDLADLADLSMWSAAEHGADFVLVNPLHAAAPVAPMEPSPYLPATRRFANPIYLRVEQIPEYAYVAVRPPRPHIGVEPIDRDHVWAAKRSALQVVHAMPRSAAREIAYRAFRRREGRGLSDYARWCAIAETHGSDWRCWPDALRDPRSPEVAAFATEHADLVDFYSWLQWQLDEQLATAQRAAVRAGMAIGVIHDLAVGVAPGGCDAWCQQEVFAADMTVGAPPDAYNQAGQDWTQRPWRPDRLAELAYAPFRDVVSTVLRHAGGVRVDHVIGLFRLWWIPSGHAPTGGTYVRYDHEALVGILALEAHRAGALVIGEDLGTVEPSARTYLRERGILGTSVLWFEHDWDGDGAPLRPDRWREYCLASVTTHDLPPTAGYLAGDHIQLRHSLGLLTRSLDDELAAATAERDAWLAALRREHLLGDGETSVEEIVTALHRYLVRTPSRLLSLALTDAVGDRRTQNQPGTIDEYPNWRVPLTGPDGRLISLEDVFASENAASLARVMRRGAR